MPPPLMGMAAVAEPTQARDKSSQVKSKYRPEIDGLRAFAVIAVIVNHFNKDLLPSGYLGVDIFFVISGYVITSSLSGRESKGFGDFLSGFYERRVKRLVPALVVFVLATSVLISLFNPEPQLSLRTGLASLFGLSNLYLLKQSTDYFAQSTELNPFTHTWSLGVEEQFYFLFPFLIWFSGFGRQAKNAARNLFLWIGALAVASLTGFIYLYQVNQPAAYFLMPSRFWEMAVGCLVFIGFQKRAKIEQALERVPPMLIIAAMVGVMLLPIDLGVEATILTVALSAILLACLKSGTAAFAAFTNKRVVYLGLISYSLYLWHWGILSISRWSIGIHWWSVPFQVVLIFVLGDFSYRFIETPFRSFSFAGKGKSNGGLLIIVSGLVALVATGAISVALGKVNRQNGGLYLFKVGNDPDQFGESEIHETTINQNTCMGEYSRPEASLQITRAAVEKILKNCALPPSKGERRRIFFIGDSQSDHFKGLAEELNARMGFGVQVAAVTSTIFPSVFYDGNNGESLSLQKNRAKIQQEIAEKTIESAQKDDLVVLSGRYSAYFGSPNLPLHQRRLRFSRRLPFALNREVTTERYLQEWSERLDYLLDRLSKKGIKTVIVLPPPEFPYAGSKCVNPLRHLNGSDRECTASRAWLLNNRKKFEQRIIEIKSKHPSLFVWDPFQVLCPASSVCSSVSKEGKSLYRDATHLSNFGARFLYSDFRDFLVRSRVFAAD